MPTYIYNDNGLYYEVDPNTGEMLYTDEAPQNYDPNNPDPTVFTKQVQVGTENDPNSKYKVWKVNNVYGYDAANWKDLRAQGYHRTLESFRDKRKAYRTILGGREITDFERMLAQDGQEPVNLTRRDLRREDIRNALLNQEYEDYQNARAVENLYFPRMRKIIELGGLTNVNAQPRIRNRSTTQSGTSGTSNSNTSTRKRPCRNCKQQQQIATQGNRSSKSRQKSRTTSKRRSPVILRWKDTIDRYRSAGTHGITKYANQIPVYQTQYAAGVPGSQEEYTERIEQTSPAVTTNTTKTSTTQATKSNKKKASSNTSSRTTSSKTTGSKQKAVNTTSSSSQSSAPASSTYSERTWVITKDPNGVEVSRVLKEQLGGLLKYISK